MTFTVAGPLAVARGSAIMPALSDGEPVLLVDGGEIVALADATPEQLGLAIAWLNDVGRRVLDLREAYEGEARRRMDLDRKWTIHTPRVDLSTDSDAPEVVWDVTGLRSALRRLVALGLISEAAAEACWLVPKPPEPKVSKRGVAPLLSHPDDRVSEAVGACVQRAPKQNRRVKVEMKAPKQNGRVKVETREAR